MNKNSKLIEFIMHIVQHYNPKTYWKMRSVVVDPSSSVPKIVRL